MTTAGLPTVVALEEHYYDPDIAATYEGNRNARQLERLLDLSEMRLKDMDRE
jgi:hypothetical protein